MENELEKIIQTKGNVRGAIFRANATFIEKEKGIAGLSAIEKKMAKMGYPVIFKKIKAGDWYPEYLSVLTILTAKNLFNWDEKDIFKMGSATPKYSFITKILMGYFLSLKRFLAEVPKYWKKHLDFGELEVARFDEEKKYIVLHEKGYKFHPIMCFYHVGYYQGITQYIIRSEKITVEETKCVFKKDPYHEYVIRWK